jgi:hypothetical protein
LAAVFLCEDFPGLRFVAAVGQAACPFAQIAPLRTTGSFFSAPPPGRLVQPLERSKRFAFFDMGTGWDLNADDIVREVASKPDSLKNWFYGDKRHEEGKAFGC